MHSIIFSSLAATEYMNVVMVTGKRKTISHLEVFHTERVTHLELLQESNFNIVIFFFTRAPSSSKWFIWNSVFMRDDSCNILLMHHWSLSSFFLHVPNFVYYSQVRWIFSSFYLRVFFFILVNVPTGNGDSDRWVQWGRETEREGTINAKNGALAITVTAIEY